MEVRIIDEASKSDIRLENEPFPIYGKMIPTYVNEQWGYETKLFPKEEVTEICFPEEDYDFEEMSKDTVFIGAYESETCIGLAVLQDDWFKYMYLNDLKVSGKFRHHGVGKMLIEKAKEVAVSRKYDGIYTVGQDNNLAACEFYLKMGFAIGGFDNRSYTGTSQEGKADIKFYLDC